MFNDEEFDFENRIVSTSFSAEDSDTDVSLRPKTLDDYIGQDKVKENLKVYIDAAKLRGESLDHVLLYGPPGLGKTTLSNIVAADKQNNRIRVIRKDQLRIKLSPLFCGEAPDCCVHNILPL